MKCQIKVHKPGELCKNSENSLFNTHKRKNLLANIKIKSSIPFKQDTCIPVSKIIKITAKILIRTLLTRNAIFDGINSTEDVDRVFRIVLPAKEKAVRKSTIRETCDLIG